MSIDFFEEELFSWLTPVDFSKATKKMSFEGKVTITYQIINDYFYLNSIFVEEEFRGQKLSKIVLDRLTRQADKYKVKIELEVVPMGKMNKKQLISLYEKFKFKVTRFTTIPGMTRISA